MGQLSWETEEKECGESGTGSQHFHTGVSQVSFFIFHSPRQVTQLSLASRWQGSKTSLQGEELWNGKW